MKTILFQTWRKFKGERGKDWKCLSNPIYYAPKSADKVDHYWWEWNNVISWLTWKNVILLMPIGDPETIFSPAFQVENEVRVSSKKRKIKDGPFFMRVGPGACAFLILANGIVSLKKIGIFEKSKIALY